MKKQKIQESEINWKLVIGIVVAIIIISSIIGFTMTGKAIAAKSPKFTQEYVDQIESDITALQNNVVSLQLKISNLEASLNKTMVNLNELGEINTPLLDQALSSPEGFLPPNYNTSKVPVMPRPAPTNVNNLTITSYPTGAYVFVGGDYKGTSPTIATKLKEGNVAIVVKKTGYQDYRQTFYVKKGSNNLYVVLKRT